MRENVFLGSEAIVRLFQEERRKQNAQGKKRISHRESRAVLIAVGRLFWFAGAFGLAVWVLVNL